MSNAIDPTIDETISDVEGSIEEEHDSEHKHEEETPEQKAWVSEQVRNFKKNDYLFQIKGKNALFYAIVGIPTLIFTRSINTLCVSLNKRGEVVMRLNPSFFFNLNMSERIFSLCHEAMHVMLQHLRITDTAKNAIVPTNVAMDIVINESLRNDYYWPTSQMETIYKNYVFVDTVFTPEEIAEHSIKKTGSWQYYYDLIMKLKPEIELRSICQHGATEDELSDQVVDDIIRRALGEMPQGDLEKLREKIRRMMKGNQSYAKIFDMIQQYCNRTIKWEDILSKEYRSLIAKVDTEVMNFDRVSRRHGALDPGLFLEAPNIVSKKIVHKHLACFYVDVSESCLEFSQKFYNFIRTLPTELCQTSFYSFDTEIYPIDLKDSVLIGGGSTAFDIIENHAAQLPKYPDIIFVISDGAGNTVHPKFPKRWVWFLVPDSTTDYIHPDSKIHYLK